MAARTLPALVLAALACTALLAPAAAGGIDDGPVAAGGTGVDPAADEPRALASGGTYCAGETLRFRADDQLGDEGKTYEVRRVAGDDPGPVVRQVRLGRQAAGVVNATGLNGTYAVFDENGNSVVLDAGGDAVRNGTLAAATWTVRAHGVVADFDPGRYAGTHWPETATLRVRRCASDGPVVVTADSLNRSTLARMLDGTPTGDGVRVPVPADGRLNVSVPWAARGEHEIAVRPAEGGPADRARLVTYVSVGPTVSFGFPAGILRVEPGGVANVSLARRGGGPALEPVVSVTGSDGRLRLRVRVAASEAGEPVAVRVDTAAFAAGAVNRSVTAVGDDEATVLAAAPDRGFAPGAYRLNVSALGDEVDVATLLVAEANGTTVRATTTRRSTTESTPSRTTTRRSATDSTAASPTVSTRRSPATGSNGTSSATTTTGGQAGYGVAVALVAVALAVLMARRRW